LPSIRVAGVVKAIDDPICKFRPVLLDSRALHHDAGLLSVPTWSVPQPYAPAGT